MSLLTFTNAPCVTVLTNYVSSSNVILCLERALPDRSHAVGFAREAGKQSRAGLGNNVGRDLTRFGCCYRWALEHGDSKAWQPQGAGFVDRYHVPIGTFYV